MILKEEKSEKSPNWDKIVQLLETPLQKGELIPGFPFKERYPKITPVGRKYELILVTGERKIATVDYSREFMSEGLQWRVRPFCEECQVAAWKEYIEQS